MTRDDIIRMAREAGIPGWSDAWELTEDHLERFAALVAAAAKAEELEACAKLCEKDDSMRWSGAAYAIRERSANASARSNA